MGKREKNNRYIWGVYKIKSEVLNFNITKSVMLVRNTHSVQGHHSADIVLYYKCDEILLKIFLNVDRILEILLKTFLNVERIEILLKTFFNVDRILNWIKY